VRAVAFVPVAPRPGVVREHDRPRGLLTIRPGADTESTENGEGNYEEAKKAGKAEGPACPIALRAPGLLVRRPAGNDAVGNAFA